MKKSRNGAIDFWKFVFSVCLVIFHAYMLFPNTSFPLLKRGAVAVEFFFLVSGFLMAASINNRKNDDSDLAESTFSFIKRKVLGIYPAFVMCWLFSFVIINIFTFDSKRLLLRRFFESIWELLLVRNAGFSAFRAMPQTWYISAMILCMLIIYPLYKKYKKFFQKILAPTLAIFILGFLFYNTHSLVNPNMHLGIVYKSTLRAFAELCLGIFCYDVCLKVKQINFTKLGTVVLSALELFGYLFTILYMQFSHIFNSKFDFVILFFLAISVVVSFSKKSSISNIFDKEIFNYLGKYSLYPYLIYYGIGTALKVVFPDFGLYPLTIIYLILTFITSLVIMQFEGVPKKVVNKIKELLVVS